MFLRKILGAVLIIGVLFPMLLFLNPFMWGMRRPPYYIPSERLEKVLKGMEKEINEQESMKIHTENNEANLWYLRDCKNQTLDSLSNFEVTFSTIKNDRVVKEKIEKYAPLIEAEIDCRCYDSLLFVYDLRKEEVPSNAEKDLAKKYGFEKQEEDNRMSIRFKIRKR
jgi:hypothetical protein